MKEGAFWLVGGLLVISGLVLGGVHLLAKQRLGSAVAACSQKGTAHVVAIAHSAMMPAHTQATQCDTLTIVNTDDTTRSIAFGQHDHHQAYDGMTEQKLTKGQNFTVTLNETGKFLFHDHLHDETAGTFTVTK